MSRSEFNFLKKERPGLDPLILPILLGRLELSAFRILRNFARLIRAASFLECFLHPEHHVGPASADRSKGPDGSDRLLTLFLFHGDGGDDAENILYASRNPSAQEFCFRV